MKAKPFILEENAVFLKEIASFAIQLTKFFM